MKTLYIRQKLISAKGQFTVTDEDDQVKYMINGSLLSIPKRYTITNDEGFEVAEVSKRIFPILPVFDVDFNGKDNIKIKKHFKIGRQKLSIEGAGITVSGDLLDFDFVVLKDGEIIANIQNKILSLADTYELVILEEQYEEVIIALVIAIDRIKDEGGLGIFNLSSLFN